MPPPSYGLQSQSLFPSLPLPTLSIYPFLQPRPPIPQVDRSLNFTPSTTIPTNKVLLQPRWSSEGSSSSSSCPTNWKREWGWDTATTTVTLQETVFGPVVTTIFTTWGVEETSVVTGNVVDITVYNAGSTLYTLTPSIVIETLYPTTTQLVSVTITDQETTYVQVTNTETQYQTGCGGSETSSSSSVSRSSSYTGSTFYWHPSRTSTTTSSSPTSLPSSTRSSSTTTTKTSRTSTTTTSTSSTSSATAVLAVSPCLPGDSSKRVLGIISLTPWQHYLLKYYSWILGSIIGWSLFIVRHILYPWKTLTVLVHEMGHVSGFMIWRQSIVKVDIDPTSGGGTFSAPGIRHPPYVLFSGYMYSIIFGGFMVFCGFDILASKIASIIIVLLFVPVLALQKNKWGMAAIVAAIGVTVALWFIDHAKWLTVYILWIGILNSFYLIYDTLDDRFHHKANPCCVVMMHSHLPALSPYVWFIVWWFVSALMFFIFTIAGIIFFRQTEHAMYCQSQAFGAT